MGEGERRNKSPFGQIVGNLAISLSLFKFFVISIGTENSNLCRIRKVLVGFEQKRKGQHPLFLYLTLLAFAGAV